MEHQAKVQSETANLNSLEDKLNRLCALEKSESSSATLSRQVQPTAGEEGGAEQVLHLP